VSRRFASSCPKPESQPTKHIHKKALPKRPSVRRQQVVQWLRQQQVCKEKHIEPQRKNFIQGVVVVVFVVVLGGGGFCGGGARVISWDQYNFVLLGLLPINPSLSQWWPNAN
jgi:hypothetical protein